MQAECKNKTMQGVTKRCRLSWLINVSPNVGGWVCGVSANEYSCAHGAQINVEALTPYLTYKTTELIEKC